MKRLIVSTLALVVSLSLAAPQGVDAQLVVGVGGGLSSATWVGLDADDLIDTGIDKGSRTGFHFSGFLAIPVSGRFSIVPVATYVQKGAVYSEGSDELMVQVDYFEIPVLASIALTGPESSVGFSVHAGPTFAFESGCDIEVTDGTGTASVDCDTFGFEDRQSMDFGVMAGASATFPLSEALSLMVSGGADFGLRTLDTSTDPSDIKNRSFYLSAFVAFPIGG